MLIIQRPTVEPLGEAEGNRQRFDISPLEPGFGSTLGNSLRRTLLSSIPGAAVTQVRFDDSLHEFATIPGVKEDVTDIILNLKDLVLRVDAEEPVTLRLDARGPGEVAAGDISTTADVEILNPDLHLATLDGKGRLAIDITVERGRGYVSAERNKRSQTIGVIPVDSIFSPVRRVAFIDRKSTRLNSSHVSISYAVFCLKKKKHNSTNDRIFFPDFLIALSAARIIPRLLRPSVSLTRPSPLRYLMSSITLFLLMVASFVS